MKNADTSTAMLADKMRHVLDTGAEVVTAGDSSCLMHIGGGLSRLRRRRPDRPPGRDPRLHTGRSPMASTFLGMPAVAPRGVGALHADEPFPAGGRAPRSATRSCGATSATPPPRSAPSGPAVVGEVPDWEELRLAGAAIKAATMARLDEHLVRLEQQVTARGGIVHWARDAAEANRIVTDLVRATGADEVVKVKSMATQEIGLNEALADGRHRRLGDRPGRADRAARPRQAVAHPGAGDPPQPGRDPRDLPARDARRATPR